MAVDYGDARTGVAVSDESATLAGDTWVIHKRSESETAQALIDAVKERGVSRVVVGYPKNMDGTIGPRAEKSEQLVELLRSLLSEAEGGPVSGGCPVAEGGPVSGGGSVSGGDSVPKQVPDVVLWDERMTTISANRVLTDVGMFGKKRKKAIDAVAASLILESYLAYMKGL